jgi:hypothetical protein
MRKPNQGDCLVIAMPSIIPSQEQGNSLRTFLALCSDVMGHKWGPACSRGLDGVLMRDQTGNTSKDVFDKGRTACNSTFSDICLTETRSSNQSQ